MFSSGTQLAATGFHAMCLDTYANFEQLFGELRKAGVIPPL